MAQLSARQVEDIVRRAQEGYMLNTISRMQAMDDLYNLHIAVDTKLPLGVASHIPSTAPTNVDTFAAQIRVTHPEVALGTLGRGSKAQTRLDKLRAAGRTWLQAIEDHEDEPLWYFTRFNLSLFGATAVRILFDEDEWPKDEDEQKHAWPFRVKAVHPETVVVSPGFRWPYAYVIEKQSRTFAELRQEYPEWKPLRTTEDEPLLPDDAFDVFFYWDAETYAGYAGGTTLFSRPNLLKMPPWVWDFSGLGHKSTDGDPDTQAVGILRHAASELVSEANLKTYADIVWRYMAMPTLKGNIASEAMALRLSGGSGRYIELEEGEDVEWMAYPELNSAAWTLIPTLSASIERATLGSDALSGQSGGARAGNQFGLQVGQARLKTDVVWSQLNRMAGRVLAIIARYYEMVLKASTDVEGKLLTPSDIAGFDNFKVVFQGADPLDNSELKQTGLAALQSRAISKHRYLREYEKVDDVEAEYELQLAEEAVQILVSGGFLSQSLVADLDLEDQESALAGAEEEARDITHQAEGVPGAPEGAPRGSPFGNRDATLTPGAAGRPDSADI